MKIENWSLSPFDFRAAFVAEFRAGVKLRLAVGAFLFFLRRAAFRTEFRAFAKFRAAFDARHFGDFHFAAAIATEFLGDWIFSSAPRAAHRFYPERKATRPRLSCAVETDQAFREGCGKDVGV